MTVQATEVAVSGGMGRIVGGIGGNDRRRFKGQLSLRVTDDAANIQKRHSKPKWIHHCHLGTDVLILAIWHIGKASEIRTRESYPSFAFSTSIRVDTLVSGQRGRR